MQHIVCKPSLLITGANVPSRVRYVLAPAVSYPNPKNKEWDYFKGIRMPAVTSRQGFQGGRALASMFKHHVDPVKAFKGLICPNYEKHPILTDGSKNNDPVNLDDLRWNNLFLFFSSLHVSDSDISVLQSVYDEVKKRKENYKIVWIPVVEQWNEKAQKEFERLRAKMPWYTAQCSSPILNIEEKWRYKGKPILVVMDFEGDIKNSNALLSIGKDGMKAFPFNAEQ